MTISQKGCAMQGLSNRPTCTFHLKDARPTLVITETQTTAWKTKCQLKKQRQFEEALNSTESMTHTTLTKYIVKVAQLC